MIELGLDIEWNVKMENTEGQATDLGNKGLEGRHGPQADPREHCLHRGVARKLGYNDLGISLCYLGLCFFLHTIIDQGSYIVFF